MRAGNDFATPAIAESPISIADVPSARVTRRLLAHELSEGSAEGRDHLIDLSLVAPSIELVGAWR